jgi:hypothetical protein
MRNAVLASVLVLVAINTTGCLRCGAFSGGGNKVYQRNNAEMLVLCDNGGFVARLTDRTIEGLYLDNGDGTGLANNGPDGELAFDTHANSDATLSTPQLGESPWLQMNLDATALDHSDVLCQDLVNRDWWQAQQ